MFSIVLYPVFTNVKISPSLKIFWIGLQVQELQASRWSLDRMILSLITYSLSPRIKPIYTVSANVSKLPPLLIPGGIRSWMTKQKLMLIFILLSAKNWQLSIKLQFTCDKVRMEDRLLHCVLTLHEQRNFRSILKIISPFTPILPNKYRHA